MQQRFSGSEGSECKAGLGHNSVNDREVAEGVKCGDWHQAAVDRGEKQQITLESGGLDGDALEGSGFGRDAEVSHKIESRNKKGNQGKLEYISMLMTSTQKAKRHLYNKNLHQESCILTKHIGGLHIVVYIQKL